MKISMRIALITAVLLAVLSGCGRSGEPPRSGPDKSTEESSHPAAVTSEPASQPEREERFIVKTEGDKVSAYIANIRFIPELSNNNEGYVGYDAKENTLRLSVTKATGSVTGAIDGPSVKCLVNCETWEFLEKEFLPEPNYENIEQPGTVVLEITDERLVEICKEFQGRLLAESDIALPETSSIAATSTPTATAGEEPLAPNPEPPTNSTSIKRWADRTVSERYTLTNWDNKSYSVATGMRMDDALVGERLGAGTATGIDELENAKQYTSPCEVFRIKTVSPECAVALKYQGYRGAFVFVNQMYSPDTLGNLIADLGLKENLSFGNIYYSYWKDGVVKDGNYETMVYTLPDSAVIWELLLADTTLKNMGDAYYTADEMGISVDVAVIGEKNASLAVNADGYLQTNILGTGKSFFIGKDKVKAFMDYVRKNGTGTVWKPDKNAVAVPE